MFLLGLPQELITGSVAPRVSGCPSARRKAVLTSSSQSGMFSAWLARALNGGSQESALEEYSLPQIVTQRYAAPRGLAIQPTPCRTGRARQKGCFSLPTAKMAKTIKWFLISAPSQARRQDEILSSMGGESNTERMLPV